MVDVRRIRTRNELSAQNGPVAYWMQRDQRVEDNWALLYAQECALAQKQPLIVVFNLVPVFGKTTVRHYDFMFKGLAEVQEKLSTLGIPFVLLEGVPTETIPLFIKKYGVGHVVTDFNPLTFTDLWRTKVGDLLEVALTEVDAHNIVPAWHVSQKTEFGAYTLRPKIHRLLPEFLVAIPPVKKHPYPFLKSQKRVDFEKLLTTVKTDRTVLRVTWLTPGSKAGLRVLKEFGEGKGEDYASRRNDPNNEALSNLSPYVHFGQVGAQRIAFTIKNSSLPKADRDAFLEELIVRRELADNYCLYTKNYDKVEGAPAWVQKTIAEHVHDARDHIYTKREFERAETNDELWNAAQLEMVKTGKMHGFMRMYWAKKILEWTPDVQTAIDIGLYLNDKYELDGTDPNGVVGVMWSMCGVHDRAWFERPVFGKIRYMNYNGCKRKFDIKKYILTHASSASLFNE